MNILDENIIEGQVELLKRWRIGVHQIGADLSRKGIQDDEIIPLLLTLRQPTFFTRDLGFHNRKLCHQRYCIVAMAIDRYEVATFVRRFLRHPQLDTQAKRMGSIIRISSRGLQIWRLRTQEELFLHWPPNR